MIAITHCGIRCYKIDGKLYPSVSAALDLLYPLSGKWVDQASMDRGTLCHAWMAKWLLNRDTKLPKDKELRDRFRRASEWIEKDGCATVKVEATFVHPVHRYAGTIDRYATDHHGIYVDDFKFAEALGERYEMQVLAYKAMVDADTARLIQVPAEGPVRVITVKPNPRLWSAFISAVNVLNFRLAS